MAPVPPPAPGSAPCLPKGLLAAESPLQHRWPRYGLSPPKGRSLSVMPLSSLVLRASRCSPTPQFPPAQHFAASSVACSKNQVPLWHLGTVPRRLRGACWEPAGQQWVSGVEKLDGTGRGNEHQTPSGCRVGSISLQPVLFPALILGSILAVGREGGGSPYAGAGHVPQRHICPGCLGWPVSPQAACGLVTPG